MWMKQALEVLINELRHKKQLKSIENMNGDMDLKDDLSLDSIDLVVLAIRIQEHYKVDIFSHGNIRKIEDIQSRLNVMNAKA